MTSPFAARFFSFRTPLRFLRGSYTRLTLTVIAIACGVALVCAIDLADRAVMRAFVEVMGTAAGRVALQVRAGAGAPFPEEVAATVAGVPGVELATPVVSGTAVTADGTEELLTVLGLDVADEAAMRAYGAHTRASRGREPAQDGLELDDPFYLVSQPDSLMLTRAFAARRGLTVGDRIDLVTPVGRRGFTVRGLLEPQGIARVFGINLAIMDVYAAEMSFTHPEFINWVDVVVESGKDVAAVADAIGDALPAGLQVQAPGQRKVDMQKLVRSLEVMLEAVGLLGLVAAFLIAFNRLGTVFEARAWQLGVLRAVGARSRVVWWELLKESLLIGGAGVALGIPLGIGFGRLLIPVIATSASLAYKLIAPDAELTVRAASLVLAAGLGLGAALLAAVVPAWRATTLGVQQTLRGRGVEQPGTGAISMWLVRGLVAGAVGVAIAIQSATGSAAWGLLATGLIAVGIALAARPLVHAFQPPLLPWVRWLTGPIGRVAMTTIHRNPRRMALTAATLGVGLGSVLWLWMLARSFELSVIDTLAGGVRADLIVTSPHTDSGYLDAPLDDHVLGELAEVPHVMAVAGQRVVDWHYAGGPITIDALDAQYLTSRELGASPPSEQRLLDDAIARGDAVNVSANFVLHLGARIGDTLTLETPSGPLTLRIAGITAEFLSPRGTIQMSRGLYARYWHDDGVNLVYLRAGTNTDLATVRTAMAHVLGEKYRLRILLWAEFIEYCAAQVHRAFSGVRLLAGLVLLVVLVGMADTLGAGVAERTRELGAIRSMGVQRRHLQRMVFIEGLALGALGFVLAIAGGLALGTLWVKATFPYLLGWVLQVHIPYAHAAIVALMTLVVCLGAAVIPARSAARLEPATALRHE